MQYQITYTVPSATGDTVQGVGMTMGQHWSEIFDDSATVVWAAPTAVILSIKALPEPTPATPPTAGA